MSFEEVKMYTVKCDNCGVDAFENTEFSCWNDEDVAWTMAEEEDWQEIEDKHICPDCWEWSEDGEEIVIKKQADNQGEGGESGN